MKNLPNILTIGRLVLSLLMFGALVAIGAGERGAPIPDVVGVGLIWFSVAAFVVASVTDFFDGWLARRLGVTSILGAILDPIADKILVCGAIVGLLAVGMPYIFAALGGLILFREFAISALRETIAPFGVRLPVTFLAKTKTTLQLVALGLVMLLSFWPAWGLDASTNDLRAAWSIAEVFLAIAVGVTLWTGVDYVRAAVRAVQARRSRGAGRPAGG